MTQSNKKLEFNIVKDIFSIWLLVVIILSATFGLMYGLIGIYSTLLGSVFSLLGLRQLSEDQYSILMSQNRKRGIYKLHSSFVYLCNPNHYCIKIFKLF